MEKETVENGSEAYNNPKVFQINKFLKINEKPVVYASSTCLSCYYVSKYNAKI